MHFPQYSPDINESLLKCFPEKHSCHKSVPGSLGASKSDVALLKAYLGGWRGK